MLNYLLVGVGIFLILVLGLIIAQAGGVHFLGFLSLAALGQLAYFHHHEMSSFLSPLGGHHVMLAVLLSMVSLVSLMIYILHLSRPVWLPLPYTQYPVPADTFGDSGLPYQPGQYRIDGNRVDLRGLVSRPKDSEATPLRSHVFRLAPKMFLCFLALDTSIKSPKFGFILMAASYSTPVNLRGMPSQTIPRSMANISSPINPECGLILFFPYKMWEIKKESETSLRGH